MRVELRTVVKSWIGIVTGALGFIVGLAAIVMVLLAHSSR